VEHEISSPRLQVPATSYPVTARSSPCLHIHFPMIHLNIIFPSTSGSAMWFLSIRLPHRNPVYASPLPNTRYMHRAFHSSIFYHPNNIAWEIQITKDVLLCNFRYYCVFSLDGITNSSNKPSVCCDLNTSETTLRWSVLIRRHRYPICRLNVCAHGETYDWDCFRCIWLEHIDLIFFSWTAK
jgi:hypothetical protein